MQVTLEKEESLDGNLFSNKFIKKNSFANSSVHAIHNCCVHALSAFSSEVSLAPELKMWKEANFSASLLIYSMMACGKSILIFIIKLSLFTIRRNEFSEQLLN
jgi:hypothetical protein